LFADSKRNRKAAVEAKDDRLRVNDREYDRSRPRDDDPLRDPAFDPLRVGRGRRRDFDDDFDGILDPNFIPNTNPNRGNVVGPAHPIFGDDDDPLRIGPPRNGRGRYVCFVRGSKREDWL